jgi:hypothetical protein
VIDLLIEADPDEIPSIVAAMLGIGFEPQTSPDRFPPERPLLLGAIDHEGARFRIHAHIVPADTPEPAELRGFRDALIADPELRAAYAARKRAIVDAGTSDSREYSVIKGDWVLDTLTRLGLRPRPDRDRATRPRRPAGRRRRERPWRWPGRRRPRPPGGTRARTSRPRGDGPSAGAPGHR